MPDEKGQPTTVYLQFDKNRMKPEMSLNDPRVKVAEESKTQKAVNHDGLTNEATKHVAEPLQKYQTEPKMSFKNHYIHQKYPPQKQLQK